MTLLLGVDPFGVVVAGHEAGVEGTALHELLPVGRGAHLVEEIDIVGDLVLGGETTRLLALAEQDEIMLLFSSGRIGTLAVRDIPAATSSGLNWNEAFLPDEPHAGELLVCLSALSHLPTSDFIVQASRRGSVKKTHTSISDKILAGHYLGRGTNLRMDEPLEVNLTGKKAILVMVTSEGRMLGLDVDSLSYAAEERIQLAGLDFVVAGFVPQADESILCLTQNGKVIQREMDGLELAKSSAVKGQALIPHSRLEQGTRFIGALPLRESDRLVMLDSQGNISLHQAADAIGAGKVITENLCLSITRVPAAVTRGA